MDLHVHNENPKPFLWTATAESIPTKGPPRPGHTSAK
jgi:hypothetical protein